MPALEAQQWWIAYDLPSEYLNKAKPSEKAWLLNTRSSIWWTLRFKFRCVRLQNSIWRLPDPDRQIPTPDGKSTISKLDHLKRAIADWETLYKNHGFPCTFAVFPIATNEEGSKTFAQWECDMLLEWAESIAESIEGIRNAKRTTKKAHRTLMGKLELIGLALNEDVGKTSPRWKEISDVLLALQDDLDEVKVYAK